MADHSTFFEPTPAGLKLTSAVLLYLRAGARVHSRAGISEHAGAAFASVHPVDDRDGRPTIGAGTPLTRTQLRQWSAVLGKDAAPEILPGNVLVAHKDVLAWWVPEQVRAAYFALSNPPKDAKALASRTTVEVPYPAHLFVATRRGLGVYALAAGERPTADTQLLFSPVLNVFIDGQLCWGNIRKPKTLNVAAMAEYESAVFDSWSTHPNNGQDQSVKGKGGLVRLWDDLAARGAKRFPVKRLKPFCAGRQAGPTTLGTVIAEAGRA